MSSLEHIHYWHFVKTFIAEGAPKTMQQRDMDTGKVKMWLDARQEYARFICDSCGVYKDVVAHLDIREKSKS